MIHTTSLRPSFYHQIKSNKTVKTRTQKSTERLENIVEYIICSQTDTLARLSVGKLANTFGIDRSHLSRQFKKHMSITLEEFILKYKIIEAANMIMSGTIPSSIEEISRKFGFCRPDYFTICFKKFMAITPGGLMELENRRRNGEIVDNVPILKAGRKVAHLANVNYFDLDFACIIDEENGFRLIVYDRTENYYLDRDYKTFHNAKSSFKRMYKSKFSFGEYFAFWTPFFRPVRAWINSRNRILESVPNKDKTK